MLDTQVAFFQRAVNAKLHGKALRFELFLARDFFSAFGENVMQTLFESAALLTKARASTDTQLKITLSRGTGAGSAGNESIEFLVKEMVYEVNSPVIEGPAGLSVQLGFRGFKASGGTDYGLQITVKNAIATI